MKHDLSEATPRPWIHIYGAIYNADESACLLKAERDSNTPTKPVERDTNVALAFHAVMQYDRLKRIEKLARELGKEISDCYGGNHMHKWEKPIYAKALELLAEIEKEQNNETHTRTVESGK